MNRVLVLGGYGGFGARLSRRLAGDGWTVIVAGRDLERARAFAATLEEAEAVCADREADLAPVLAEMKPDLLVDAAGPFQASSYRVPQACIAAGAHYLDLADARDFVGGIGALDGAAQRAGVAVVGGASTLPALSGAVVRELSEGLDRVDAIEIALSAAGPSVASRSVAEAMLSYAGRPIRLWRGRRTTEAPGCGEPRRVRFAVDGSQSLMRTVLLAEVPDLDLLPDRVAGRPAVAFRAGNEFAIQLAALRLLAWPVRRGRVRSLRPLAGVLAPIQRAFARFGSDRSAMAIEIKGWRGGEGVVRRWTVIAERGEGPEIPVLAAQLLARRLREGALAPGACDGGGLLSLDDFRPLLGELALREQTTEEPFAPLYARAMGTHFAELPAPVRAMHRIAGDGGGEGEGEVRRGTGLLARMVGAVMGFPPEGRYPVHVAFAERGGTERWSRHFGRHRFHSEMSLAGAGVAERFGPLRFAFDLIPQPDGLAMKLRRWTAFGVPLPLFLGPRIAASERAEGEDFVFDVAVALPWAGPVVHYRGRLRRL